MAIQYPNFQGIKMPTPDYSAATNLVPNILQNYQEGQKHKISLEEAARKKQAEEMANKLMADYGEKEKKAELALAQAKAQFYSQGGAGTLSPFGLLFNERQRTAQQYGEKSPQTEMYDKMIASESAPSGMGGRSNPFSSLPPHAREAELARIRPLTPHMSDIERVNLLNSGMTYDQFREQAKINNINPEEVKPIYMPTTANITGMKNKEAAGASLSSLEKNMADSMEKFPPGISGLNLEQAAKAIVNHNPKEQGKFLATRAMQPEVAGARQRISNGSNAHEALNDAKRAALGYVKIVEGTSSGEAIHWMNYYINKWLDEEIKASGEVIYNPYGQQKKNDIKTSRTNEVIGQEYNYKGKAYPASEMFQIRNTKTGATRLVPREEAEKMSKQK